MIEHRWGQRFNADHGAVLITREGRFFRAKLRNVSAEGLYAEVDVARMSNAFVKVRFTLPGDGPGVRRQLWAAVVHRTATGVGLFADPARGDSAEALRALLKHCAGADDGPPLPTQRLGGVAIG